MKEVKKLQHLAEVQLPRSEQKMIMGGNTWTHQISGDTQTCENEDELGDSDFVSIVKDEDQKEHKVKTCV